MTRIVKWQILRKEPHGTTRASRRSSREVVSSIDGQAILSLADIQFALHFLGEDAGIAKGDVIVAIDGRTEAVSAPEFAAFIRLNCYRPGSRLELSILRDGQRRSRTLVYP